MNTKKHGVAECKLCGLRAYSKNVRTRSVFPTFEGRPLLLESYESMMVARRDPERAGQYLFGTNSRDWTKEDAPYRTLADQLIDYLKTPDAKPEDLRILLCVHDWVQDEGTETV